jgi:hypothetical protein
MDQVSWSNVMGSRTTEATSEAGEQMIEATVSALAEALSKGREEEIPIPDWNPEESLRRLPELKRNRPR